MNENQLSCQPLSRFTRFHVKNLNFGQIFFAPKYCLKEIKIKILQFQTPTHNKKEKKTEPTLSYPQKKNPKRGESNFSIE